MSSNHKNLQKLVGVGLRAPYMKRFMESPPCSVGWVEVVTENYLDWESQEILAPRNRLLKVREKMPVVFHGVSLSVGTAGPVQESYVRRLKKLCDLIEPAWVSDHLCWTGTSENNLHDLFPLPETKEAIEIVVAKLDLVQNALKRPFGIENISSYVQLKDSEMPEWEFVSEIIRRSGAFLLLDINNVYVNSVNHGFDPWDFLENIPHKAVKQIHLAGHQNKGDYLFDTHDAAVSEEVWKLFEAYIQCFGPTPSMIERDDHLPEWEELEEELARIGEIMKEADDGAAGAVANSV